MDGAGNSVKWRKKKAARKAAAAAAAAAVPKVSSASSGKKAAAATSTARATLRSDATATAPAIATRTNAHVAAPTPAATSNKKKKKKSTAAVQLPGNQQQPTSKKQPQVAGNQQQPTSKKQQQHQQNTPLLDRSESESALTTNKKKRRKRLRPSAVAAKAAALAAAAVAQNTNGSAPPPAAATATNASADRQTTAGSKCKAIRNDAAVIVTASPVVRTGRNPSNAIAPVATASAHFPAVESTNAPTLEPPLQKERKQLTASSPLSVPQPNPSSLPSIDNKPAASQQHTALETKAVAPTTAVDAAPINERTTTTTLRHEPHELQHTHEQQQEESDAVVALHDASSLPPTPEDDDDWSLLTPTTSPLLSFEPALFAVPADDDETEEDDRVHDDVWTEALQPERLVHVMIDRDDSDELDALDQASIEDAGRSPVASSASPVASIDNDATATAAAATWLSSTEEEGGDEDSDNESKALKRDVNTTDRPASTAPVDDVAVDNDSPRPLAAVSPVALELRRAIAIKQEDDDDDKASAAAVACDHPCAVEPLLPAQCKLKDVQLEKPPTVKQPTLLQPTHAERPQPQLLRAAQQQQQQSVPTDRSGALLPLLNSAASLPPRPPSASPPPTSTSSGRPWGASFGLTSPSPLERLSITTTGRRASQSPVAAARATSPLSSWFLSKGHANFVQHVAFPPQANNNAAVATTSDSRKRKRAPRQHADPAAAATAKRSRVSTAAETNNAFLTSLAQHSSWRSWYSTIDDPLDLLDPPLRHVPAAIRQAFEAGDEANEEGIENSTRPLPTSKIARLEAEISIERARAKAFEHELLQMLLAGTQDIASRHTTE